MKQQWTIVGGSDKRGILVRSGQGTTSEQLADRLGMGALVEELELVEERLHFLKVSGAGPDSGWVSVKLKDKVLATRVGVSEAVVVNVLTGSVPEIELATLEATVPLKEGDYYVTLGVLFKKQGGDPETQKIIKVTRKVGSIVHTTGKIWRGPTGGFWVELDVSVGDSGVSEKPGYVMIDAKGFDTPGPCLQKASSNDGPPLILNVAQPEAAKSAWDGTTSNKEFVVLQKTQVSDVKVIISLLFNIHKDKLTVVRPQSDRGGVLTDETTMQDAGFETGDQVHIEYADGTPMTLRVMNPLDANQKLIDLQIKDDWFVGQVRDLFCNLTGLKKTSTVMMLAFSGQDNDNVAESQQGRGKMGSEDSNLKDTAKIKDSGFEDGDEICFLYTGSLQADLKQQFLR